MTFRGGLFFIGGMVAIAVATAIELTLEITALSPLLRGGAIFAIWIGSLLLDEIFDRLGVWNKLP